MQYRALGLSLLSLAPVIALSFACSCGDSRPVQDECATPDDDATITSIRVTGEHVYGIQGGEHVQVRVFVEGTGLGTCTHYEAWIEDSDGFHNRMSTGSIPLMGSDTSAQSSDIYFFVNSSPFHTERVAVRMFGQTVYTGCVASSCPDAAVGDDAGFSDDAGAVNDASAVDDAGQEDASSGPDAG